MVNTIRQHGIDWVIKNAANEIRESVDKEIIDELLKAALEVGSIVKFVEQNAPLGLYKVIACEHDILVKHIKEGNIIKVPYAKDIRVADPVEIAREK